MLSRIVEWYNEIKVETVPCEFEIIKKDIELIDNKLQVALESATWSDYEQVYISDLHSDIKNLHTRTMQTKVNVDEIVKSLKSWGSIPMYQRHDGVSTNLMWPEEFPGMILRRQISCQESKKLIDLMMDENFRLFFNLKLRPLPAKVNTPAKRSIMESIEAAQSMDEVNVGGDYKSEDRPSETDVGETDKAAQVSESLINIRPIKTPSTSKSSFSETSVDAARTSEQLKLFRPYEEHIDSVIWSEICEALRVSMKYLKFEMENRLEHDAPIFEIKLELGDPRIIFIPAMETNSTKAGLLEIVNSMVENILSMSDMIHLVAQPVESRNEGMETFVLFLETASGKMARDVGEIEEMQLDILSLTRDTIKKAVAFAQSFENYNFLWLVDKRVHMNNFLRYGKNLSADEIEKVEEGTLQLPEKKPDLEAFKNVIDFYNELYDEINKIEQIVIFKTWLKVDMKGLKYRMINEIFKWSNEYKKHLKEKVMGDLNELERFITASTESLNQQVTKEDSATLLTILKTIGSINDREYQTGSMFEPLKEIVDLLTSYDVSFNDFVNNQFAELPERWITLRKLAVFVKLTIAPVQAYQVDLIKKRIQMFDLRTKLYHENFMRAPFFDVPCPDVYQRCDLVHRELTEMEMSISGLRDSALHFQLISPEESRLNQCRKLVKMVKHIWDFHNAVSSCIENWKKTAWKRINVEDMEAECKKFNKDMRTFDKDMKLLRPYLETEAIIKNLLTSLRAITELQNPAIRERHWTELMYATKVS